jgi:hypothetical protein
MASAQEELAEGPLRPSRLRRAIAWIKGKAEALRPGPRFWRGGSLGAVIAALSLIAYLALSLRTGLGKALDVMIALLAAAMALALSILVILLIVTLLRAVPRFVVATVSSAVVASIAIQFLIGVPLPIAVLITIPVVLIEASLGAAVGAVAGGELKEAPALKKAATGILLFAAIGLNAGGIIWLARSGSAAHIVRVPARDGDPVQALNAPDPSEPGSFQVRTTFYGSGEDLRRPEYGSSVEIKTDTVDGTPFLKELTGFKAGMRRWYWGFDRDRLPINGRVWYPEGDGPFPLVLVVHGNHRMEEYSDPGYAYLGKLLASRGMITVSVDENFLNGSWSGDLKRKEMAARAWLLLQHLKAWQAWNSTQENPFYRKVDLENIALIGHSRGGEAVAVATVLNRLSHYPEDAGVGFDFNFSIKSVIAIAPVADSYAPSGKPLVPENVNYLLLHGAHDADVSIFMGNRTYNRVKFTGDGYWFNASLYIYRANHGQFNTVWGESDWSSTFKSLLNLKPLLGGEEQRRVARLYISAFLGATLKGERAYLPMFRDYRVVAGWLPDTIYVSQFNDSTFRAVCDYEEDPDVTTTTVAGGSAAGEGLKTWREQRVPLRAKGDLNQDNSAVYLGWEGKVEDGDSSAKAAFYRITLPTSEAGGPQLDSDSMLVFSLGNAGDKDEDPDFTIELATTDGVTVGLPFSQLAAVAPRLKVQFSKIGWLENLTLEPAEIVLQTYELPLAEFRRADARFDPARLKTITFRFDRTRSGEIALDRVGFRKG